MASGKTAARIPWWAWVWPFAAWLILVASWFFGTGSLLAAVAGVVLFATVFAAVHHAEVVAHRIGEPFGTLVLALAVTVIETALIVSVMLAAPAENAALARDTIFAVVMIVCNGIVGACLLWGGVRHHEQTFRLQGASAELAVLTALTVLTLILPNFAISSPGPSFSTPQLIFDGAVSLALYSSFIFTQTVRHRDYFLPLEDEGQDAHTPPPSARIAAISAGLLLVALVANYTRAEREAIAVAHVKVKSSDAVRIVKWAPITAAARSWARSGRADADDARTLWRTIAR